MKRKIITYSLLSVFLFSIIGVPITQHYCQMMEQKSISSCDICKDELVFVTSSCCDEETEYNQTISSVNPVCCQDEFVFSKIDDEFLITKSDLNLFSLLENIFQQVVLIPKAQNIESAHSFYSDSSPPFLINPEIHITNSALLI